MTLIWDFNAIFAVLSFATGSTLLAQKYWLKKFNPTAGFWRWLHRGYSYWLWACKEFFVVILLVTVLRVFIAEPFRIPSESMLPTLETGDWILTQKWKYGLRLPGTNTRLTSGVPQRGDIAVFRYPENRKMNYIKRVIGLPGDVIDYRNKKLTINGVGVVRYATKEQPIGLKEGTIYHIDMLGYQYKIQEETYGNTLGNMRFPITVPEGQYFVMGDNRDHSADSRFWGFVPDEDLVGRAFFIWFNPYCLANLDKCKRIGTILD